MFRCGSAFTLLLVASLSLFAADTKSGNTPDKGGPLTGDKIKIGTYTGKLLSLPTESGDFTVEITTKVPELKPNALDLVASKNKFLTDYQNGKQNIQRDLQSDRNNAAHHLNRMRDHENWFARHLPAYLPGGSHFPYQTKDVVQTVDFHAAPDVQIRLRDLPPEFDDKGKLKKRTQSELNKLKGKDRTAPGYEAKKEDLMTGALVVVTLSRAPRPRSGSKSEFRGERKNHVTTILIVSQDGQPPEANSAKK